MTTNIDTEQLVTIDGREYRLVVSPVACGSIRHRHVEAHADGSSGREPHHHHSSHCDDLPRQATLYPTWQPAERHVHAFTPFADGSGVARGHCRCGAERADLPVPPRIKPGKRVRSYAMPADDVHPHGWSYERWDLVDE